MTLVSGRYLPLIGVNPLTSCFDGLLHQLEIVRRDDAGETQKLVTRDAVGHGGAR